MISYRGIGVIQRSYQDTSSEVGVTWVITPLPSGEGKGEGPLTNRGISVITPLPSGEGKGEGPLTNRGNLGDHSPLHSERGWG